MQRGVSHTHTHTHTCDKTNRMNSDAADLLIEIILSVSVLAILTSNKPHTSLLYTSNTELESESMTTCVGTFEEWKDFEKR